MRRRLLGTTTWVMWGGSTPTMVKACSKRGEDTCGKCTFLCNGFTLVNIPMFMLLFSPCASDPHLTPHCWSCIDYPNQCVLLFGVLQFYNYLVRIQCFTKQSHKCFIMSEQLIKLSSVHLNFWVRCYCIVQLWIVTHTQIGIIGVINWRRGICMFGLYDTHRSLWVSRATCYSIFYFFLFLLSFERIKVN